MNPISSPRFSGKTQYQNMGPDTPGRIYTAIMQVTFRYGVFAYGNLENDDKTWSIQTKGPQEAEVEADAWLGQELSDLYQEDTSTSVQKPVPLALPTPRLTLIERIRNLFARLFVWR